MPAARVSGVTGAKAIPRGASPPVNVASSPVTPSGDVNITLPA